FQAILGNLSSPIPHMRYCHVSFLSSLPDFRGRIPSSALTAAFLVRLEHPRIIFAAFICAASSSLTTFLFPSHTSPHGGGGFWCDPHTNCQRSIINSQLANEP
ncbi:unnamed protein product, partial [Ectocarpus fasciculatus]